MTRRYWAPGFDPKPCPYCSCRGEKHVPDADEPDWLSYCSRCGAACGSPRRMGAPPAQRTIDEINARERATAVVIVQIAAEEAARSDWWLSSMAFGPHDYHTISAPVGSIA